MMSLSLTQARQLMPKELAKIFEKACAEKLKNHDLFANVSLQCFFWEARICKILTRGKREGGDFLNQTGSVF